MDCRAIRSKLPDYQDGALSAREARAVLGHLDGCPSCREALEDLRAFDGLVGEFMVAPAPAYRTEDLLARLDDTPALEAVDEALPALEVGRGAPRLAAAAMLLLGAAGLAGAPRVDRDALRPASEQIQARMARMHEAMEEAEAPGRRGDRPEADSELPGRGTSA